MRWVREFGDFAINVCREEGGLFVSVQRQLGDGELCRLFIMQVGKSLLGFSVPRSARRHLSAARVRLGFFSLVEDAKLRDFITAYERKTPRTVRQVESLHVDDVDAVVEIYSVSHDWWELQTATFLALGFVTIMRMGERLRLNIEDVLIELKAGGSVGAESVPRLPRASKIAGLFVHLCWRKADQSHGTWIPVACPRTLGLIMRQLRLLRQEGRVKGALFTSRIGGQGTLRTT